MERVALCIPISNKSLLHTTEKDEHSNQPNVEGSILNNPERENVEIKDFQNHTETEVWEIYNNLKDNGSFIKRQTSGTTSDNEWQRVEQRVATNDNEWQRVTTSTTSDNKWQRVTNNDNEWQWMKASGKRMKTNESK